MNNLDHYSTKANNITFSKGEESSSSSDEGKHIGLKYITVDKATLDQNHTNLTNSKPGKILSRANSITNKISSSEYISNNSEDQSATSMKNDKLVLQENR